MSPYGGDERDRTADPLLARQVLSQLSYTPISWLSFFTKKLPPRGHAFGIKNGIEEISEYVSDRLGFKQLFVISAYAP